MAGKMDCGPLHQNKLQLKTGSRSEEHSICNILLTPVSTLTPPRRLGQNSYNLKGREGSLKHRDNPAENYTQPLNPLSNPVSKDQEE